MLVCFIFVIFVSTKVPYTAYSAINPTFESFIHSYWTGKDQVVFSYEPSKMLRVISPKSVLEKFLTKAPEEPLRILVKDVLLPENNGIYTIEPNKKVHFQPTGSYDLKISIQALAQLITSRFSAQDLYRWGELVLPESGEISLMDSEIPDKITKLDRLFPKMITFYPEYD